MNLYNLMKIEDQTVVIATTSRLPIDDLAQLEADLHAQGANGSILFDLYTVNGSAFNRFIRIDFDGFTFDRKSCTIQSTIPKTIDDALTEAYIYGNAYAIQPH